MIYSFIWNLTIFALKVTLRINSLLAPIEENLSDNSKYQIMTYSRRHNKNHQPLWLVVNVLNTVFFPCRINIFFRVIGDWTVFFSGIFFRSARFDKTRNVYYRKLKIYLQFQLEIGFRLSLRTLQRIWHLLVAFSTQESGCGFSK